MIDMVTIDGPVGVGKSTVAARLASRLGWAHLDTGATYRAVALLAMRGGVAFDDEAGCAGLAGAMHLRFVPDPEGQRVELNGEDVSEVIRTQEVSHAVARVADLPAVRAALGRLQRELGVSVPSVVEGRDMGTIVFHDARWKFYLDADPVERVRRRGLQLVEAGRPVEEGELIGTVRDRDYRDRTRPVGALRVAPDAIVMDTTGMSLDRVLDLLESLVRDKGGTGR